uniref:Sulfatase domain-containing protein n=1 Tax=Heterorhabditis bacteriophora TaxID=37862 RepID=A0A1I7X418_HETBA
MGGVTFDSYPDPFMSLVNSNLTKTLMNIMGSPLPLPNVKAMGYFPLYNHTSDEDYLSKTGKGNTDDTALIQRWANMSHLPWWGDRYSQDISNSGDGSFQKPQLTKKDSLKQFQSFTCRFKIDKDAYDTTSEKNKGYRYENVEKIVSGIDYWSKSTWCRNAYNLKIYFKQIIS